MAPLVCKEDKVWKLVNNVSKKVVVVYPKIEKLVYSLLIALRKLPHYFQVHPMVCTLTNCYDRSCNELRHLENCLIGT